MARKQLRQSGIEQFVIGYLAKLRNVKNKRSSRKLIQKAISLIGFYLDRPCCTNEVAEISYTRYNDSLTRYVANVLNGPFDRRKWSKSLERTRDLLENFLNDPCCIPESLVDASIVTDDYTEGITPVSVTVTFGCVDNYLYEDAELISFELGANINSAAEALQAVADVLNTLHGGQFFVVEEGGVFLTESNGPLPTSITDILEACDESLVFTITLANDI